MSAFDRRLDPEVRKVRRLEVITGALGRRRWSAEAKARIFAESLAPGVVISEVERRHDLRPPGRGAEHAIAPLAGFSGVLQVDAYGASKALADPTRRRPGDPCLLLVPRVRRRFYEIAQGGNAPIAEQALTRLAALYRIEAMIRGLAPEQRRTLRHDQSRPIVDELRVWLDTMLVRLPRRSRTAEAIPYALKLWCGLTVFLDDGRIEIDSNTVERATRPIALNRKNALFAGSDQGGVHWGVIASLIETCKLNAVDPQAYLASTLTRLVNRHPASQIDQLMPWAYPDQVP